MEEDDDDLSAPFQQQKKRIAKPPPKKVEPAKKEVEEIISNNNNNDQIVPMEIEKPLNLENKSTTTIEKPLDIKKKLLSSKPSVSTETKDKDLPSFSKKKMAVTNPKSSESNGEEKHIESSISTKSVSPPPQEVKKEKVEKPLKALAKDKAKLEKEEEKQKKKKKVKMKMQRGKQ